MLGQQGRNAGKYLTDILMLLISIVIGLILKHEGDFLSHISKTMVMTYVLIFTLGYFILKLQNKSWTYTNSYDVLAIFGLNTITTVIMSQLFWKVANSWMVFPSILIVVTILQMGVRFLFRLSRHFRKDLRKKEMLPKTLIYGAGEAGVKLIEEARRNSRFQYNVIGLIDDDKKKLGLEFYRIKVLGTFNEIAKVIESEEIESVIVAIPSIDKIKMSKIVKELKGISKDITIKTLPHVDEILDFDNYGSQVKEVSIEDLLGREEVLVNSSSIEGLIKNKVILITGGAGSIGSEIARQVAKYNPKLLVIADVNENALYFLELELTRHHLGLNLQSEVLNIRESEKVRKVISNYKPDVIFHAAAHKHVPLMEHNPEEAIKNNIFGTRNVMSAADEAGVPRFVLISTDKAVNPTNVMGATKRGCELVLEDFAKKSKTKFMAVRFGNVLGSNGSVIPHFRQLIAEGKNLTVTHKDITRFFMTIPEAAQLVIEAGSIGSGGEVFILDMGEPIRIMDLAQNMIDLSGADVKVEVTGLRPGEKLYEELLYNVNEATKTDNKKIFIAHLKSENIDVNKNLNNLKELLEKENNNEDARKAELKSVLKEFVTSYKEVKYE